MRLRHQTCSVAFGKRSAWTRPRSPHRFLHRNVWRRAKTGRAIPHPRLTVYLPAPGVQHGLMNNGKGPAGSDPQISCPAGSPLSSHWGAESPPGVTSPKADVQQPPPQFERQLLLNTSLSGFGFDRHHHVDQRCFVPHHIRATGVWIPRQRCDFRCGRE